MNHSDLELPLVVQQYLAGRLAAAIELARVGGQSTLEWFCRTDIDVERKGDDSPVTVADRGAEQLIRNTLSQRFPDDAVLGEEFGEQAGTTGYRWIVDPIDGTKSFISGVPLYSTLIGVVADGQCKAGVIYIPALDELVFAGRGIGAWHSRRGAPLTPAVVSKRQLKDGLFVASQLDSFAKRGAKAGLEALEKEAYVTRTWGDGYGYLLVATGRAELMVDPVANAWDLAAVEPIIEEAGGRFTSWSGKPSPFEGDGIATNGLIHRQVLDILSASSN